MGRQQLEGRECVLSSLEPERGQETAPGAAGGTDDDDDDDDDDADADAHAKQAVSGPRDADGEPREHAGWSEQD